MLDRSGKFNRHRGTHRIRPGQYGYEYVLAWKDDSGANSDIVINEVDIDNFIRAKSAISAGVKTLVEEVGLASGDLEQNILAGAFGSYIDLDSGNRETPWRCPHPKKKRIDPVPIRGSKSRPAPKQINTHDLGDILSRGNSTMLRQAIPTFIRSSKRSGMQFFRLASLMLLAVWGLFLCQGDFARADDPAPTAELYPNLDDLFTLYQPYLGNIAAYEPIYFLVGTNPEKSKFQFSFRYRLFNPQGSLAVSHPWVNGLNFAYTQTSFWDLKSDSAPFEDTSYKPELFHLTTNNSRRPSWMQGLFLQSGARHESNGRAEEYSRSTNILYLKPVMIFYNKSSRLGLQISPKVWFYINNSTENNDDLPDYRGYFQLEAKVGHADGLVASTALGWAKEGGSVQVDLNYPVPHYLSDNLAVYLHFQYVNTLAESLLNYQERTKAFRLGLSFIR